MGKILFFDKGYLIKIEMKSDHLNFDILVNIETYKYLFLHSR